MSNFELFRRNFNNSTGRSTTGVITLLLAALLFVATAILGFSMVKRMKEGVAWVLHTYDARSQIRSLRNSSTDLTAQVALATELDDPATVTNIGRDLTEEHQTFSYLRSLIRDNSVEEERARQLEPLFAVTRSQLMNCSRDLHCLPSSASERRQFLGALYDRHEKALAILGAMETEEQALLGARLSAWSSRFEFMVVALAISFLSAVFLVFFNLRLLLKEVDRRVRSEQLIREHVDSYRVLSGRILELQDTERRRIARELHDSVGQYLAGVKFQLGQLERAVSPDSPGSSALFAEASDLLDRCLSEIRTISHLLHPPLLDELGLYSAARWYVEGFAERSGLQVDFTVDDFVDRLHKDAEIALFRVLQESLTNVHRHSGAKRVQIDISCNSNCAILMIKDDGSGIPPDILRRYRQGHGGGIGLAGMRERLAELRGTLEVKSSSSGTILRASIPMDACRTATQETASVVA